MFRIFMLSLVALIIACGGDYVSYTNIVQTQTADNQLGNATAEAGGEAECTGSLCKEEVKVVDIDMPDGPILEGDVEITIGQGGVMDPQTVKINLGATVTWLNPKGAASSSSSDEGQADMWDSGAFNKGPFDKSPDQFSYSREFTVPGCFKYRSLYSGDADTGNFGLICVIE